MGTKNNITMDYGTLYYSDITEAKAKEKEQIIDANIAGMKFIAVDPTLYQQDAEQYYNEEYNK